MALKDYLMWRYYAFRVAAVTLAYLPFRVGYLVAYFVADIVYVLNPKLRNSIAGNMKQVLGPETDNKKLNRVARGVLRNTAKNYFDFVKVPHVKLADLDKITTVHNFQYFEEEFKKGKGVILTSAHLGSFDIAVQMLARRSIKTTVLVEPLEPPALHQHVTSLRQSNGISFLPADIGAIGKIIRALRKGEVVLLVCDRDIAGNGIKANFFGKKTTMPTAAVRIAMRTGAAVIPVFNLRRKGGGYNAYFEPAVEIVPSGDDAVVKNLERVAIVMEKYIKKSPEQWVVLNPFWEAKK